MDRLGELDNFISTISNCTNNFNQFDLARFVQGNF